MYKVMLVDDETYMINGLKSIINWEEYGLEITAVAFNGVQALEILDHTPVDIILTDIKMPKMNGLDLISTLKQRDASYKFIILSGYNDFDYLKQALKLGIENYLLKPINVEELSQTLINAMEVIEAERQANIKAIEESFILKNNILNRWATNTISPAELTERAQLLNIDLNCNCYIVCILRIWQNKKTEAFEDQNTLRRFVIDACYKALGDILNDEVFSDVNGDILLFFSGNSQEITYENIKKLLQACIDQINYKPAVDVFLSVGSIEMDFRSLHNSYFKARELIEYMLILQPNHMINYDDKFRFDGQFIKDIDIRADYFKNLILSSRREEVDQFIDHIYEKVFSIENTSPKYIKNLSVELLYIINKVAKEKKMLPSNHHKLIEDIYRNVYDAETKLELIDTIKETALSVMATPDKNAEINPLIQRTIEYIINNISGDLSLKHLSVTFNVNPSYLGQLFKSETGELFTNYLNKIRIEKAIQLLTTSKLNANEIALRVGYVNANYFYTCFKKFTGKYPMDYRRDILFSSADFSYVNYR